VVATALGAASAATALAYAAGDWIPVASRARAAMSGAPVVMALLGGALLLLALGLRVISPDQRRAAALGIVVAAVMFGAGRGVVAWHTAGPDTIDGYLGGAVAISGTVDATGPSTMTLRADAVFEGRDRRPVSGGVVVPLRGAAPPLLGERVIATGSLRAPPRISPGGATNYADRLERRGIWAELQSPTITSTSGPSLLAPATLVAHLQQRLKAGIEGAMPQPEAALLLGEIAGIHASMPAADAQALVDSGLAHILAISGIKVALVIGMLTAAATAMGGRRVALAALSGVALYTVIGGASASALRSALMGSLTLVGRVIRRDADVLRSLIVACAAMLAWHPELAADVSFQYSFLGVLGIHLYTRPIAARLTHLPRPWREALAVTVAAQVATLPVTAYYFHVVPLLAPIANAIVLPTLPLVIVCGFAVAVFQSLSLPLAALAYWTAHLTLWLAHALSSVPHAAPPLPWLAPSHIAAYYIALAGGTLGMARRWRLPLVVVIAGGLSLLALVLLSLPDGKLHVRFLAGVTGPAVVVIAPDGATLLIDGGSSASQLAPALDAALPPGRPLPGLGRRLDAVLLTGGSREESGSLSLSGRYRPGLLITPAGAAGAAGSAGDQPAQRLEFTTGDRVDWHRLQLRAYPGAQPGQLVLDLRYGASAVLITDSVDGHHPVQLPSAAYDLVALGSGAAAPIDDGVSTRALILQRARASGRPVAHELTQRFGSALWRTDKDGELAATCDTSVCNW
jgi:competence protein ComEC